MEQHNIIDVLKSTVVKSSENVETRGYIYCYIFNLVSPIQKLIHHSALWLNRTEPPSIQASNIYEWFSQFASVFFWTTNQLFNLSFKVNLFADIQFITFYKSSFKSAVPPEDLGGQVAFPFRRSQSRKYWEVLGNWQFYRQSVQKFTQHYKAILIIMRVLVCEKPI